MTGCWNVYCLVFCALLVNVQNMYAAREECAQCHKAQAIGHPLTSMSHAMEAVSDCAILRRHPKLTFQDGKYKYQIVRQGDRSIYTVTDGVETITVPIGWAFGLGAAGQTYVFRYEGNLYESRVSFFQEINGLDLTMGAANMSPRDLVQAAGRLMDDTGARQCFACHSTNSVATNRLHVEGLTPGIQCERCHGATEKHLASFQRNGAAATLMPKLGKLTTEEVSNFCGQCHRTWEEIASHGPQGIGNVRFQPYRLTNSKCYDTEDKRISCIACHDPHQDLVHDIQSYDSRCLACHAGTQAKAKGCPVEKQNCVGCHMPKLELPGAHYKFTDHEIRIVRGSYPD